MQVALLAEGVDRNTSIDPTAVTAAESPSSRRAWIEITASLSATALSAVALLAEGVDRNHLQIAGHEQFRAVALLAEGVDRNSATQPIR